MFKIYKENGLWGFINGEPFTTIRSLIVTECQAVFLAKN